jgi:hypothetical protein
MCDRMRATVGIGLLAAIGALPLAPVGRAESMGVTAPTPPLPGVISTPTVSRFPVQNDLRRYPIYNARGHLSGYMSWLVTPAGGELLRGLRGHPAERLACLLSAGRIPCTRTTVAGAGMWSSP